MSVSTKEPDSFYWEMYIQMCKAEGVRASLSDYDVWLQEMDLDRKENWETDNDLD